MKFYPKGIWQDGEPVNQPEGTIRSAWNMLLSKYRGAYVNEAATERLSDLGKIPIGSVLCDKGIVVFLVDYSANNVSDDDGEIGLINKSGYSTIVKGSPSDATLKFDFNIEHQIEAEAKINNQEEVIIAWTDDYNPPRIMNIDDLPFTINGSNEITAGDMSDIRMFPSHNFAAVTLESVEDSGGSLKTGVNFYTLQLEDADGNLTPYMGTSGPVYITNDDKDTFSDFDGSEADVATSKRVNLELFNLDSSYKYVHLICIQQIGGELTAFKVSRYSIPSNYSVLRVTHTGGENTTELSLEEVLAIPASFQKAKTLAQHGNRLYLANTEYAQDLNYQKWANNIVVNYEIDTVDTESTSSASFVQGIRNEVTFNSFRTFLPGEVYALYAYFNLTDGTRSQAYHLPGRGSEDIDEAWNTGTVMTEDDSIDDIFTAHSSETYLQNDSLIDGGAGGVKYFHTRSTANNTNAITNMGYWENTETYPDDDRWNSSSLGGEDLRSTPVRHHKFPSVHELFDQHNGEEDKADGYVDLANKKMAILGVTLSNIVIPAAIADRVESIGLAYAKRTENNITLLGQSMFFNGAHVVGSTGESYTNSCNCDLSDDIGVSVTHDIEKSYFRFHPFEMMYFKPTLPSSGAFIQQNVDIASSLTQHTHTSSNLTMHNDATDSASTAFTLSTNADRIKSVEDLEYLFNNGNTTSHFNEKGEEVIVGEIDNSIAALGYTINALTHDDGSTNNDGTSHASYLSDLKVFRTNIFSAFDTQELIIAGMGAESTVSGAGTYTHTQYGGDGFACEYHIRLTCSSVRTGYSAGPPPTATFGTRETKILHAFFCYSNANINFRHDGDANDGTDDYQRYHPKLKAGFTLTDFLELPAYISEYYGYNPDYSQMNDLYPFVVSPQSGESVSSFPTMVARTVEDNFESTRESWKNFLPNDYFILSKKWGEIWKIESDGDKLYIHTPKALLQTLGNTRIQADDTSAYLGSGDIFSSNPSEIAVSDIGYMGTQSQWATLVTEHGYFFPDTLRGKIFLLSKNGGEISLAGMSNFFKKNTGTRLKDQIERLANSLMYTKWDNPSSPHGTGAIAVFDPENDRIIYTVKDYLLKDEDTFEGEFDIDASYEIGESVVIENGRFYAIASGSAGSWGRQLLNLTDSRFADYSYTISYSVKDQAWVSFHAYKPSWYGGNSKTFFSVKDRIDTFLYKHNQEDLWNTVYQSSVPSEIFIVVNTAADVKKILQKVMFKTEIVDTDGVHQLDETFDKIAAYNTYQCTGDVTLTPEDWVEGNVVLVQGVWHFDNMFDIVSDHTSAFLQTIEDAGVGKTAFVTGNLDSAREWTKQTPIQDNWFIIKLSATKTDREVRFHGAEVFMVKATR